MERTSLDPSEVGDIVVGTVIAPGSQRAMECRVAAYFAGFPGKLKTDSFLQQKQLLLMITKLVFHLSFTR